MRTLMAALGTPSVLHFDLVAGTMAKGPPRRPWQYPHAIRLQDRSLHFAAPEPGE